jgi:hypothetical protein
LTRIQIQEVSQLLFSHGLLQTKSPTVVGRIKRDKILKRNPATVISQLKRQITTFFVKQGMVGEGYICWRAIEREYQMVGQFFSLNHHSFSQMQVSHHHPNVFGSFLCEQSSHRFLV